MNHPKAIQLLRSWLFLALSLGCMHGFGQAPAGIAAGSSLTQVSMIPDLQRNGLHGIGITYKLTLPQNGGEGGSIIGILPTMALTTAILDENQHPVPATAGVNHYAIHGYCVDSMALVNGKLEAALRGDTVFIPYCAMDLEPGRNKIFIQLSVNEILSHKYIAHPSPIPAVIVKPQLRIVRLEMLRITTQTANANGELWDYKFFNPKDAYPDLQWTLMRGRDAVYESEKQKNDTVYTPTAQDRSPWFFISQSDKIQLVVSDFDLLGASDLVGQKEIDVDKGSYAAGVPYDFSFDQVRNVRLKLDAILPPKVVVSSYQVIEGDKDRGVSGLKLQMNYDAQSRNRECEFLLGLALRTGDNERIIRAPRILGPGAIPAGDGQLLLTAAKSSLELFIPSYSLSDNPDHATQRIRMDLITKIDGQYLVVGRVEKPLLEDYDKINDMVFGQWKVGVTDQAGAGGIRLSLDYELPQGYFESGHPNAIALVPNVVAPWGKVRNSDWIVLGTEKAFWRDSLLLLQRETAKGTLDLFLPFRKCQATAAKPRLSAAYDCQINLEGKPVKLGTRGYSSDLEIPPLRILRLSVREAAVIRSQWLLSNPNLFWVFKVGETEIFRSPIKASTRDAKWQDEIEASLVVADSDLLQIQVIHKGGLGEADRVIETWQGLASDIPDKPKGLTRLKPANLKRLVIHSYSPK